MATFPSDVEGDCGMGYHFFSMTLMVQCHFEVNRKDEINYRSNVALKSKN